MTAPSPAAAPADHQRTEEQVERWNWHYFRSYCTGMGRMTLYPVRRFDVPVIARVAARYGLTVTTRGDEELILTLKTGTLLSRLVDSVFGREER